MSILKINLCVLLLSLMFSFSLGYAGVNKTLEAWEAAVDKVTKSISDKETLAEITKLDATMANEYQNMDRSEYYTLASKTFRKLIELSTKHGSFKINLPSWID